MPKNMLVSGYDNNISNAFKSLSIGGELSPSSEVKAALKDGAKLYKGLVDVLDPSNNKNIMGLFSRPRVVQKVYFIEDEFLKKHRENYKKDQAKAKKDPNYKPRIPSPEEAGLVREEEIEWDFNRYMHGSQLSLNQLKAGKDLDLLIKTLKDLQKFSATHQSKIGMLGGIFGDWGNSSSALNNEISGMITQAEGLKSTLSSVLNYFARGADPKTNMRAAGAWIGQLRGMSSKMESLMRSLTPITTLNNANLVPYLLTTNRLPSSTPVAWIDFAIACSLSEKYNKNLPSLAKSLVATGFAPKSFHEDMYYSKPYVSDHAKQFWSNNKFDRENWLKSLSSGAVPNLMNVWLSYNDGGISKQQLLDVAGEYLSDPKSTTYHL